MGRHQRRALVTERLTILINGPALSAEGLTKRFDDRVAFRGVSFLRARYFVHSLVTISCGIFAGYPAI